MRVVMISDAHLEGLDDPKQAHVVAFLDRLECDRLFILGDLFHHWWGFRGAVMSGYVPVVAALHRLRRAGVSVTYVPGNHDFAVGPVLKEDLGIEVAGPHVVDLDGVGYLVAHGDEADASLSYRLLRAVLRGSAFDGLIRALGPAGGSRLLSRLAGESRAAPAAVEPLLEAQRAWAQARMGPGVSVAVMGHLHVPAVVPVEGGTVVHLGDWVVHRSFLCVESGRGELRVAAPDGSWRPQVLGCVPGP